MRKSRFLTTGFLIALPIVVLVVSLFIGRYSASPRTVVELLLSISSHFPNQALGVASHIALMKDGTFVAQGPPDQVVTENNLRTIYDVDVRIYTVKDPTDGRLIRFCSPAQLL